MSWPKRLKKQLSRFSMPWLASASPSPRAVSSRMAWGRRVMPTPSSRTSGALSYTRQKSPRWCRARARVSPPMPPPTIAMSMCSIPPVARESSLGGCDGQRPPAAPCVSASARRGAEDEVAVLIHGGGPAGVHERARVGLLDDGGTVEHVVAQKLAAIEHRSRLKAPRLGEPDRAVALLRARGRGTARGQGRPPGLRCHTHRGEADVYQLHGVLGRRVAVGALVHRM